MTDVNLLEELEESPAQPRKGLSVGAIILLAGMLAVVAVIGIALVRAQRGQPTAGVAPDFTLTTFDGQEITLSELRGQVVVINFWASWCGPCREEAPALERLWQRYRDQGVVILGVTYADDDTAAMQFMRDYGMTYPAGPDRGTVISKELYFIQGVPETFVVDRDGNIAEFIFAMVNEEALAATIERLLAA